jgi:hypothetical protein
VSETRHLRRKKSPPMGMGEPKAFFLNAIKQDF